MPQVSNIIKKFFLIVLPLFVCLDLFMYFRNFNTPNEKNSLSL